MRAEMRAAARGGVLVAGFVCLCALAACGAAGSGRDAVDAAYAFYLDEPDRVWKDDCAFVEAVFGADFVKDPPVESVVFSHVKTRDRNVDTDAALKLRGLLEPGDVIVSVLTNGFFARIYSGDVLDIGKPKVLGPVPGSGKLWEADSANLLFNYDWEEFALATGAKSGPAFRLVRPVLSPRCRIAARRRHPEGKIAPVADERVRGLAETAYALYLKGTAAQYCFFKLCAKGLLPDDPKDYTWTRTSRNMSIEDCTPDRTLFSVCSSFPIEIYRGATGLRLRRGEPGCITHYMHVPEDFVVYRYDVRYSRETITEAVAKIRALIRPGDVVTGISLPHNGHTMVYIGDVDGHAKAMHSTGRNYDGHPKYVLGGRVEYVPSRGKDVFELEGNVCCDDLDALMFTPGHYEYLGRYKQLLLWRPFLRSSIALNDTAKARLAHPRLRYDRRVEGGVFGAVESGGELGYSVWLKNFSDGGYEVPVEETLPEGTELVSASEGCMAEGRRLRWNVFLGAKQDRLLAWRVKVNLPAGSAVVSGGGSAGGIPSNTLRTQVLPTKPSFEKSLAWARKNVKGRETLPPCRIDGWYGGFRTVDGDPDRRTRETRTRDLMVGDVVFSIEDLSRPDRFRTWVKSPDGFVELAGDGLRPVSEKEFTALLSADFFVGLRPAMLGGQ